MAIRKDNWSTHDDATLASIVLRHIQDGSTQLTAFEEVAAELSRTAAACGFRWNSEVRKRYETEIKKAKTHRQHAKRKKQEVLAEARIAEVSMVQTSFENPMEMIVSAVNHYQRYVENLQDEIAHLKEQNSQLLMENQNLQNRLLEDRPLETMSEDYQVLVRILDNARRLGIVRDEIPGKKFHADPSGNLEIIRDGA